ncbi:MAG: tetratricopeptide repeat protein [Thermoanaerobaculia bacterium]
MRRNLVPALFLLAMESFPVYARVPGEAAPTPASEDTVAALPPPATRSGLRGRWFEFQSALNEDDIPSARLALTDILKTADRVGISRLSDFSRAALQQARLAEKLGKQSRANLAIEAAIQLDPDLLDARWELAKIFLSRRQYGRSASAIWASIEALARAQESRREFLSNFAILAGTAVAVATAALILALLIRYIRPLLHDLKERSGPVFGNRGAAVAAVAVLGLPIWLSFGPLWLFLYWSILVSIYAETRERVVLWAALAVVGLIVPALQKIADENLVARSPLVSAAIDLNEKREEGGSVDLLRRASQIFPEESDVWYLLGRFAQRRDDYDEASADYAKALKDDPRNFRAMIAMGNIRFWQGDLTEAMTDYRNALQVRSNSALAFYNLSVAQGDSYLFDQQKESLANARRLSPHDVDHWIESPTLARVLSLDYSVDEAAARSRRWGREPKSQILPGIGHESSASETFTSVPALGPWVAVLLGALVGGLARSGGFGAEDCVRCGRPFCRRCKPRGTAAGFCRACVRLFVTKEGADIAAKVAHSSEARRQQKIRQRERRFLSLLLPGASRISRGQPAAGFAVFLAFFFLLTLAFLAGHLFPIRSLPSRPLYPWREAIAGFLAFALWLGANIRATWT